MPISELCSSFYLFKPLEKCVLLDTRGMGYESVAWYESISITGQKQQKSHVLLRRCQWCYSSPVKTVRPVTLLLVPQLSLEPSPTCYFPLLMELSSLGAQFIFGGVVDERKFPRWSVTPFSTNINWVAVLWFPNQSFLMQPLSFKKVEGKLSFRHTFGLRRHLWDTQCTLA